MKKLRVASLFLIGGFAAALFAACLSVYLGQKLVSGVPDETLKILFSVELIAGCLWLIFAFARVRMREKGRKKALEENDISWREFGVALEHSPDFGVLAQAYGVPCGVLDSDAEIDNALDTMLKHDGPYILCCRIDPDARTGD